ncbi:hypothetical protein CROQUDRAFT_95385 [Cronartium quercuum f. sp. fusiforme G11]|uniref:Secreted protein n=1 Tax=Cronartium quercuum f. sp. fusiforme G11 TaxID=708437 RepID=A0A9P6TA07_9BASI|nr:hypothetical protein CROQUDRAFT_95385 [Cronartium quercuum f. sp. fusiforme G11]
MLALITIVLLSSTLWSSTLAATTKAPPSPAPQRCGMQWATVPTGEFATKTCQNFGGAYYKCVEKTCFIGRVRQPIDDDLYSIVFEKCHRYIGNLGNSPVDPKHTANVSVWSYSIYWSKNYSDVFGMRKQAEGSDTEGPSNWKCPVEPDTINKILVCGNCTYEAPPKP